MKASIKLFAITALAFSSLISCQKKETPETTEATLDEAEIKQEQAQADLNEARSTDTTGFALARTGVEKIIADNEVRIAEFRLKAKTATEKEKKDLNDAIDKLEVRNNKLKDELNKFQETTDDKLREFVSKSNKDAADIQKDIEKYRTDHY